MKEGEEKEKIQEGNREKTQAEEKGKKKRSKTWLLVLIILLLAAVIAGLAYYMLKNRTPEPGDYPSGYVASWSVDIPEEVQEEIASQSQEQIVAPGFGPMTMAAGSDSLNISIGNPEQNHCYLKITVSMDDGTVLFESGLLEPGTGYQSIPLNKTLSAGTYNIIVHYQGYSMDDAQNELNAVESAFVLTVE